jgi:Lon protease-like protein
MIPASDSRDPFVGNRRLSRKSETTVLEPDLEFLEGELPILPQPKLVLLPHVEVTLHLYEQRHVRIAEDTQRGSGVLGIVRFRPGWEDEYFGEPPVRKIGCAGRILDLVASSEGRLQVKLLGLRKFEIVKEVKKAPHRTAEVRWIFDGNADATDARAKEHVHRIIDLLERITRVRGAIPAPMTFPPDLPFAGVVNLLASQAGFDEEEMQRLLELQDVYAEARAVERVLKARLEVRRQAKHGRDAD